MLLKKTPKTSVIFLLFIQQMFNGALHTYILWAIQMITSVECLVFFFFFFAKSLQSYPTLCDPIDGSPPGSSVPGILQARTLEWVAISFSNASKWKVKVKSLSRVRLLGTPWTAAYQAPPSMGFSRQDRVPLRSPMLSITRQYNWCFKSIIPFYPSRNNMEYTVVIIIPGEKLDTAGLK